MARRRSRSSLAVRWIGLAVLAAIAVAYVHPLRAYQEAQSEVAQRKAEIARLGKENAALARRLSRSDTEAFIVREARKLGLVRAGERLFIIRGAGESGDAGIP
jgi:cell division protein FtsB